MSLSWDAPLQAGDSSINDYWIYYKDISSTGNYSIVKMGNVNTTKVISSLSAGTYRVYVTSVTGSLGEGKESYGIYVTVT